MLSNFMAIILPKPSTILSSSALSLNTWSKRLTFRASTERERKLIFIGPKQSQSLCIAVWCQPVRFFSPKVSATEILSQQIYSSYLITNLNSSISDKAKIIFMILMIKQDKLLRWRQSEEPHSIFLQFCGKLTLQMVVRDLHSIISINLMFLALGQF